jgi:hypothetical protein
MVIPHFLPGIFLTLADAMIFPVEITNRFGDFTDFPTPGGKLLFFFMMSFVMPN